VIAPDIVAAIPRGPYVVRVVFADGEVRDVDIEPLLDGPVFEPLQDPVEFGKVSVDPETRTIAWPNGADLDPDVLYDPALRPASGRGPRITVLRPAA
jgi:Protein of unknown function (DUF2442)